MEVGFDARMLGAPCTKRRRMARLVIRFEITKEGQVTSGQFKAVLGRFYIDNVNFN